MGRSDARQLKVPEGLIPPDREEQSEAQPVQEEAAEPESPPPSEAQPVAELEACPHCGVRLSSLDLKTNHCFKCNAMLTSPVPPASGGTESTFEVHI